MRIDDFLLIHNIAQSSYTFLRNNSSLQIYDKFIMLGRGIPTSRDTNGSTIWVMVIYILSRDNKVHGVVFNT